MAFGTSSIYWDPDTQTLSILSAHGAWRVRLWPEPDVVHVAGPGSAAPPLFLELAAVPSPRSPAAVAVALASRSIPERVRTCVLSFAPASEQLSALRGLYRVPGLVRVLTDRPVLGRIACAALDERPERVPLLVAGLAEASDGRAGRQALLDWLGLPVSPAFERILGRTVSPASWTPEDLRQLADWYERSPKMLWHLQVVSPGQVRMREMLHARGLAHLLTRELLVTLQHHISLPVAVDLAEALDVVAQGERHAGKRARPCRSGLDFARRMLDAIEILPGEYSAAVPRTPDRAVACPVECPPWIHPLGTHAAHVQEGDEMAHCLVDGSWFERQARGEGYAFAVTHEDGRVTAWLESTAEAGVFMLTGLHGHQDADPPLSTEAAVRAWVDTHNAWARHAFHGAPRPLGATVVAPQVGLRFVDLPHDLTRTLMLTGRVAEEIVPLGSVPEVTPHLSDEQRLIEAFPRPCTVEQDVRDLLTPLAAALREGARRLASLIDRLEPAAAAGRELTDEEVFEYLIEVSRSGLFLSAVDRSHGAVPTWPPERAAFDPATCRARREDDPELPF